LIRVTGFQACRDFVAFRGFGQTSFFAAFQFGFEVITIGFSFDSSNEAIAFAIDRRIIDFASFFERKFRSRFAVGFRLRLRSRIGRVLRSALFTSSAENAYGHFGKLERAGGGLARRVSTR